MDAKGGKRPRRYRLKARAERQDENRRKIVEAAYRLHMTVGPSRTTTSAIARLSGVERPTVRRHFPDFLSLFMACSLHGMTLDPPPDASAWTQVTDPAERLRRALTELYESYRRNRTVFADMDNFRDEPGLEGLWAMMNQRTDWQRDVLAQGWEVPASRQAALLTALTHAIDFLSWRSLTEHQGLDDEEAARLMTDMVSGVARTGSD